MGVTWRRGGDDKMAACERNLAGMLA